LCLGFGKCTLTSGNRQVAELWPSANLAQLLICFLLWVFFRDLFTPSQKWLGVFYLAPGRLPPAAWSRITRAWSTSPVQDRLQTSDTPSVHRLTRGFSKFLEKFGGGVWDPSVQVNRGKKSKRRDKYYKRTAHGYGTVFTRPRTRHAKKG
jgi:hypothetical protein